MVLLLVWAYNIASCPFSWADFCFQLLQRFIEVHNGSLQNVDILTGGLLETTKDGPGELFRAVIIDQFVRIRDGDRFWFENRDNG